MKWLDAPLISFFLGWTLSALNLGLAFVLYLGEKGFEIISWIPSRQGLDLNTFQNLMVLEVCSIWNQQENLFEVIQKVFYMYGNIIWLNASG